MKNYTKKRRKPKKSTNSFQSAQNNIETNNKEKAAQIITRTMKNYTKKIKPKKSNQSNSFESAKNHIENAEEKKSTKNEQNRKANAAKIRDSLGSSGIFNSYLESII